MDIKTQLKLILANQQQIMTNQVRILGEHMANYGPKQRKTTRVVKHIKEYEQMINDTSLNIELTRQTRMAL